MLRVSPLLSSVVVVFPRFSAFTTAILLCLQLDKLEQVVAMSPTAFRRQMAAMAADISPQERQLLSPTRSPAKSSRENSIEKMDEEEVCCLCIVRSRCRRLR